MATKVKLTKKQKGFVKDYIETENGAQAVMNHYDVKDNIVAKSIASENLTKPYIITAIEKVKLSIAERLPDELLAEKHLELLHKTDEKGALDVQAVTKGLDMAYKLKGSYAGEKSTNLNLNVDVKTDNKDLDDVRKQFEEQLKQKLTQ